MTPSSPTPPSTPPSCSDCTTKTNAAGSNQAIQSSSRMWKASDGKMRFDMPHASIISDPVSQQTILLDHLKKEARIIPTPPAAAGSAPPGMPQAPAAASQAPHMKVENLGKSMIEGHEVEGKRYTLPAFTPPPKPPAPKADLPKMANAPQAPHGQKPSPPQAPQAPKLPNVPSVTELWTSTKLKIPVLTKVSTAAGEQTTYCKPTSTQEPPPSTFKIPPEYKIVPPNAPPSKVQIPKIQPPKIQAPKVQPPKLPKA